MAGRKRHKERLRPKEYDRFEVGPHMLQATPDAVFRAIARVPSDLDWGTLRDNVLPIFPRRRPMPPQAPDPIRVSMPPGVLIGFGVDIGPAYVHVHEDLLASWPVTIDGLTQRSLGNLRDRTRRARPRDVQAIDLDHVVIRTLQTRAGWASTLLLLPDELIRIFGDAPQCFIAPMRDVLMSFPADVDRDYLAEMNEEFAALDPNALALEAFLLRDGCLTCEPLLLEPARA